MTNTVDVSDTELEDVLSWLPTTRSKDYAMLCTCHDDRMDINRFCRRNAVFSAFFDAYERYCDDSDEDMLSKMYSHQYKAIDAVCEEVGWVHVALHVMRIGDIIDDDLRKIDVKNIEYRRAVDTLVDRMYRAIYRLISA